ncbi:TfuA-like protein [Streptomyces sp. NBC_00287]|uniref:TfuA-like protein n=1 Tax=Streptomyces sp. NBC_00287 TaxID=2975702 RepID=UPI002E2D4687|nr:TfuA-like protein [Streptomyces sp. NBC_00287]
MTLHVFSGPTLTADRVRRLAPDAVCHPPVGHGDLLRLGATAGDAVVIIDGVWHQRAPVRHKEILLLLDAGVAVVGAASMGALRAAELAAFGMLGVGRVFEAFRTGQLEADDEVAVLHTSDGQQLTEALVNLRCTIRGAAAARQVTADEAAALEEMARRLPYTRRTWTALHRAAAAQGLGAAVQSVDLWRQAHPYDLKRQDAEHALRWADSPDFTSYQPFTDALSGQPWRTSFTTLWQVLYAPAGQAPAPQLPLGALMQYEQLYDPGFPQRWRNRVLAAIARCSDPAEAEAAVDHGAHADALTADQVAFWLTEAELTALDPAEMLRRVMVRSATFDSAWDVWPATREDAAGLLADPEATASTVAAALELNAAVAVEHPRYGVDRLAPDRLARHVAARWNLTGEAGARECDAAARDRGFRDWSGAVGAARSYYLLQRERERNAAQ